MNQKKKYKILKEHFKHKNITTNNNNNVLLSLKSTTVNAG